MCTHRVLHLEGFCTWLNAVAILEFLIIFSRFIFIFHWVPQMMELVLMAREVKKRLSKRSLVFLFFSVRMLQNNTENMPWKKCYSFYLSIQARVNWEHGNHEWCYKHPSACNNKHLYGAHDHVPGFAYVNSLNQHFIPILQLRIGGTERVRKSPKFT